MAPRRWAAGEPPPVYGPTEPLFSVEMKHGGFLCGVDSNKCYVDGRTAYFDGCEVDTWSPLWIKDFIEQLGHDPAKCFVYWLLPGMSLNEGLRIVDRDIDTLNMTMVVPKFQHFTLYVDQPHLFDDINLDDVAIVGSPTPTGTCTGTSTGTGTSSSGRRPFAERDETPISVVLPSDSDDSGDEDFVDSDNDIEDDDDLYDEWVDKDVEPGQKKKRDKPDDSDYDTDELELPCSDEDEEDEKVVDPSKPKRKIVQFTTFRPEDLKEPEFKMGMCFPTVNDLRKALTEYSIKNRTVVAYWKNDQERLRAYCPGKPPCPWFIYGSRHGTIQHCSICSSSEHNKRKCPDLGRGDIPVADILGDNLGDLVHENVVVDEPIEEEFRPPKRKLPVRRMPSTEATQTASTHDDLAQSSQTSMLDTLLSNAARTQQSQVAPGPLPESSFIASSRDPLPPPRARRPDVAAKKKKGKASAPAASKKKTDGRKKK